jgi:tRNA (uracil-5-)-methyltransferase TRM9
MGVLAPGPSGTSGVDGGQEEEEEGGLGGGKGDQDVLVPWVLQEDQKKKEKKRKRKVVPRPRAATFKGNVKPGEDEEDQGEVVVETDQVDIEVVVVKDESIPDPPRQVYHRYYHLYTKGELKEDVIRAAEGMGFDVITLPRDHSESINENEDAVEGKVYQGKKIVGGKWLKVTGEGYEKDNWYLEGEVGLYA